MSISRIQRTGSGVTLDIEIHRGTLPALPQSEKAAVDAQAICPSHTCETPHQRRPRRQRCTGGLNDLAKQMD